LKKLKNYTKTTTFGIQAEVRDIMEDTLDDLVKEVIVYLKGDNRLISHNYSSTFFFSYNPISTFRTTLLSHDGKSIWFQNHSRE